MKATLWRKNQWRTAFEFKYRKMHQEDSPHHPWWYALCFTFSNPVDMTAHSQISLPLMKNQDLAKISKRKGKKSRQSWILRSLKKGHHTKLTITVLCPNLLCKLFVLQPLSRLALRWMCDSPQTRCAQRTTPYISVTRTSDKRMKKRKVKRFLQGRRLFLKMDGCTRQRINYFATNIKYVDDSNNRVTHTLAIPMLITQWVSNLVENVFKDKYQVETESGFVHCHRQCMKYAEDGGKTECEDSQFRTDWNWKRWRWSANRSWGWAEWWK